MNSEYETPSPAIEKALRDPDAYIETGNRRHKRRRSDQIDTWQNVYKEWLGSKKIQYPKKNKNIKKMSKKLTTSMPSDMIYLICQKAVTTFDIIQISQINKKTRLYCETMWVWIRNIIIREKTMTVIMPTEFRFFDVCRMLQTKGYIVKQSNENKNPYDLGYWEHVYTCGECVSFSNILGSACCLNGTNLLYIGNTKRGINVGCLIAEMYLPDRMTCTVYAIQPKNSTIKIKK